MYRGVAAIEVQFVGERYPQLQRAAGAQNRERRPCSRAAEDPGDEAPAAAQQAWLFEAQGVELPQQRNLRRGAHDEAAPQEVPLGVVEGDDDAFGGAIG